MNVYIYLGACSHVSVEGHGWCHVSSGSLSMLYDTASLAEPRAHYFYWSRYPACFRVLRLSPLCHRIPDRLSQLHGLYVGSGDPRPHSHACWVIFPAPPLEFYIWNSTCHRRWRKTEANLSHWHTHDKQASTLTNLQQDTLTHSWQASCYACHKCERTSLPPTILLLFYLL